MKKAVFILILLALTFCAALAESPPVITADGDLSDWAGIYPLCEGEDKIAVLYAFKTDTHVCIAFSAPDNTDISIYDVMLDTDMDATTGFGANGRHKAAGLDFLVETWCAGWHRGESGDWDWAEETYPILKAGSGDKTANEVVIPLETLGNPDEIRIIAWACNSDWENIGFAPEIGKEPVKVPYYTEVIGAPITEPLADFTLTVQDGLRALTDAAAPGGEVAVLSAKGGDGVNFTYSFQDDAVKGRDNHLFALQGDRLLTGGAPLAPGSYKIACKVQSGLRKETAAFIVTVGAQDPDVPITPEIFDGQMSAWYTVPYDAANALPRLMALKAMTDGNRLYFYAECADLNEDFALYIGTEKPGGGADGFDDMLCRVAGTGEIAVWDGAAFTPNGKKARLRVTDAGVEGQIMLAHFDGGAKALRLGFVSGDDRLPETGALDITSPNRLIGVSIKADGDGGDWGSIEPLAQGSGVVGDLYAVRTNDTLYVKTTLSGVEDPDSDTAFSLNILLNTDRDGATGFLHTDAYPAGNGADALIQDWHSMGLEFFTRSATSEEWFAWISRPIDGIKKNVGDLGDGVYQLEYAIPIALLAAYLPEMSDDLYICLDRETDMQEGTSVGQTPVGHTPGSAYVLVPKVRTTVEHLSIADGTFADWDAVSNKALNRSKAAVENLFAARSQNKLFLLIKGAGMSAHPAVYLAGEGGGDIDGYQNIAYIVREGRLYPVSADGAPIGEGKAIQADYYLDHIEMSVPLADIPGVTGVAAVCGDIVLPEAGVLTLEKTFAQAYDENAVYPAETFERLDNPYHGWVAWASDDITLDPKAQSFQTVYLDIKWAELEAVKGVYDFAAVEEKYHLNDWKERGVRVVLRFVMDDVIDNGGAPRMDIPEWLYDELVAENWNGKGAGTFYYEPEDLGGGGFSPNYESPILLDYHGKAVAALAERFDDPAITAYVQVGSLGHWAEMHCWPDGTGEFPNPELVGQYMETYQNAFKRVKLAARKPYPYAAAHGWGLYNDMFGDVGATDTFCDYFLTGCTDMPFSNADEIEASRMPDFWKTMYSGGEFAEGNVRKWTDDDAILETLRLIRNSHASLIGPCSPTDLVLSDPDAHDYDVNFDIMRRTMGYRLSVERVEKTGGKAGETVAFKAVWRNRGVSPFYYDWPIVWMLRGDDGEIVALGAGDTPVTKLLPGRTDTLVTVTLPDQPGAYVLCVSIPDPDLPGRGIHLAMEGEAEDLSVPVSVITVE